MASNYNTIAADIKTKMQTISGIGNVHDYYRWNKEASKFLALFAYTPAGGSQQIRGWELSRISATEHKRGAFFRHHRFKITGYMSLRDADATDKTFQTLVDDICEKFRTADGGATWDYRNGDSPEESPAQAGVLDVRQFGEILCHYAEIFLSVTERIVA